MTGGVVEMAETKLYKLLPVRDFPMAAVVATGGVGFLWVSGHPPEEWPAIVVVFYVTFRLSLTGVVGLLAHSAKLLAAYGKRVLRRHGMELPPVAPEHSVSRRVRVWLITVIVLTVLSISAGFGIAAIGLASVWLGITPLASAFYGAAWGMLGCGAGGLMLLLGAPALVFFVADVRIRIRVSEGRLASALALLPEIQAGIPPGRNRWI